jgi:hypothetical protein
MRQVTKVSDEWLEGTNRDFADRAINVHERFDHAERKWQQEHPEDFTLNDGEDEASLLTLIAPEINKIRSFFLTQRNKDLGWIGFPLLAGIYYYGGAFWEVEIPMAFGMPRIDMLGQVKMPTELKRQLATIQADRIDYIGVFGESFDYAYSIEELDHHSLPPLANQLFASGDKHLRAVKALLFQSKASSKAIEDARMTIEMFLKGHIVLVDGLTDTELKKVYSHNLEKLVSRCVDSNLRELDKHKSRILQLPDISSRYEAEERTFGELWAAYRLALKTALLILRPITGRDFHKQTQFPK